MPPPWCSVLGRCPSSYALVMPLMNGPSLPGIGQLNSSLGMTHGQRPSKIPLPPGGEKMYSSVLKYSQPELAVWPCPAQRRGIVTLFVIHGKSLHGKWKGKEMLLSLLSVDWSTSSSEVDLLAPCIRPGLQARSVSTCLEMPETMTQNHFHGKLFH